DFINTQLVKKKIILRQNDFFKSIRVSKHNRDLRVVFDTKLKIKINRSTIVGSGKKAKNYKLIISLSSKKETSQGQKYKEQKYKLSTTPLDSLIADKILTDEAQDLADKTNKAARYKEKVNKNQIKKLPVIVID